MTTITPGSVEETVDLRLALTESVHPRTPRHRRNIEADPPPVDIVARIDRALTRDGSSWLASLAPRPVRADHEAVPPGLHACDCGIQVDTDADPHAIDPDDPQTVTCDLCRATWDTDDDDRSDR